MDVLGSETCIAVEAVASVEAGKGEVRLGLLGDHGRGGVELPNHGATVEEGEDAYHPGVVGECHFDSNAVCQQLRVVVGELVPVLWRNGVAQEEAAEGGAPQSAGAGVGSDGEVRGAFNDDVDGDARYYLPEE